MLYMQKDFIRLCWVELQTCNLCGTCLCRYFIQSVFYMLFSSLFPRCLSPLSFPSSFYLLPFPLYMYLLSFCVSLSLLISPFLPCLTFTSLVGTYGLDCSNICKCQNGATCDFRTGACTCGPGWQGEHCEYECSQGHYGYGCRERCACTNGASCQHVTGECSCTAGWMGDYCNVQCQEGKLINIFGMYSHFC